MKWKQILIALILGILLLTPTAYAEEPDSTEPSTVVQITDEMYNVLTGSLDAEPSLGFYPVNVTAQQIDGVPYITKIFEVGSDVDAEGLVRSFQQDGYNFTRYDVSTEEIPGEIETTQASKSMTVSAASNSVDELLAALAPVLDYNEAGFTGQLQLDAGTIQFAETGRSNYQYTLQDTRSYTGLARNDGAYIEKTVQKNGVTLQLESVAWEVAATMPIDGGLVPTLYNATATYTGIATGSKVDGYTATVTYAGEVVKQTPDSRRVSIVYRGELPESFETTDPVDPTGQIDPTEPTEPEKQEKEKSDFVKDLPLILAFTVGGSALLFGGMAAVRVIRKQLRKQRYNASYTKKGRMDQ